MTLRARLFAAIGLGAGGSFLDAAVKIYEIRLQRIAVADDAPDLGKPAEINGLADG